VSFEILLFGGTFDPIHNGHLVVSRAAGEQLGVGKVVLVPSGQPPHKLHIELSDAEDRLAMAQLAVQADEFFEVSDCELRRSGPSFTLETVRHFKEVYRDNVRLYWLIGADTIKDLPNWYEVGRLADECTIVTAGRPGYGLEELTALGEVLSDEQVARLKEYILDTPLVDVSATEVRRRVAAGLPILDMVPGRVVDYIVERGLYDIRNEA